MTRDNVHELEPQAVMPVAEPIRAVANTLYSSLIPDDSNVGPDIRADVTLPVIAITPAILAHKIRVLIRTVHHLGNDGQNLMLSYLLSATD